MIDPNKEMERRINQQERLNAAARRMREKEQSRKREVTDWIRWGLTFLIALAGLINSILARLGI